MIKSLNIRLAVVFVACLLSIAMVAGYGTSCRYLTTIEGGFSMSPATRTGVTATLQDGEITLQGGDAYIYLYLPQGVEIESVSAPEGEIPYILSDAVPGTAVYREYGEGRICRFSNGNAPRVFENGQKLTVRFGESELLSQVRTITEEIKEKGVDN